jgi:hypothetical protein
MGIINMEKTSCENTFPLPFLNSSYIEFIAFKKTTILESFIANKDIGYDN